MAKERAVHQSTTPPRSNRVSGRVVLLPHVAWDAVPRGAFPQPVLGSSQGGCWALSSPCSSACDLMLRGCSMATWKSTELGIKQAWVQTLCLLCTPACWPRVGHWACLSLSFPLCKMGTIAFNFRSCGWIARGSAACRCNPRFYFLSLHRHPVLHVSSCALALSL